MKKKKILAEAKEKGIDLDLDTIQTTKTEEKEEKKELKSETKTTKSKNL